MSIDESLQNYTEVDEGLDHIGGGYDSDDSNVMVNTMDQDQGADYNPGEANQELLDMLSGIGEEDSLGEEGFQQEEDFSLLGEDSMSGEELQDSLDEPESSDAPQSSEEESAAESLARQLENLGLDMEEEDALQGQEPSRRKTRKRKKKHQRKREKMGKSLDFSKSFLSFCLMEKS